MKKKQKRQSEGGGTPSKSKYMSRAEVVEIIAEEKAFHEGVTNIILKGLNDIGASISTNLTGTQKKLAFNFVQAGKFILNDISKLHSGAKGDSE